MPARFVDDYYPRIELGFAIADGHVGGATCETPGAPNGSASWLQGVGVLRCCQVGLPPGLCPFRLSMPGGSGGRGLCGMAMGPVVCGMPVLCSLLPAPLLEAPLLETPLLGLPER